MAKTYFFISCFCIKLKYQSRAHLTLLHYTLRDLFLNIYT